MNTWGTRIKSLLPSAGSSGLTNYATEELKQTEITKKGVKGHEGHEEHEGPGGVGRGC